MAATPDSFSSGFNFSGKRALVTGAGKGIGRATAKPTVVLTDAGKLGWSASKKAGDMLSKISLGGC